MAATHIIKKLPMANLQWKSPFERLYGKPPTYEHLRIIGCLSFAINLKPHDKFDSRAQRCILLGYTHGYKGYKLYNLETKKIFHNKDVLFHENVFPFKDENSHLGNLDRTPDHIGNSLIFPSAVFPYILDNTPSTSVGVRLSPSFSQPLSTLFPDLVPFSALVPSADLIPSSPTVSTSDCAASNHSTPSSLPSLDVPALSFSPSPVLRRSSRTQCPPAWLQDYLYVQQAPSTSQTSSQSHTFTTSATPYP